MMKEEKLKERLKEECRQSKREKVKREKCEVVDGSRSTMDLNQ